LYGKTFEEEDGKEYIMRVYDFTTIGELKFRLQEKYGNRFNLDKNPEILSTERPEWKKGDTKHTRILLAAVKPYFEADDVSNRRTPSVLFSLFINLL
jgi:hypothetical protein